jgi:ubiquinone/menaquinone biosynthesis C-methylase UbiE
MSFDFHAAYDELNADDHDYRFYASLAQELGAHRVLDLGCGTGTLALLLSAVGHEVVAIDPDEDMLRVARDRPGADAVGWRLGHSDAADVGWADLAVMSGHVAQVFVEDEAWETALRALHRALRPGGALAFESRHPGARGWKHWYRENTLRTVETDAGPVEFWHQTLDVDLPRVTYATYDRNLATGEESCDSEVLAFRDVETLRRSLEGAGFDVTTLYGDWSRTPVTETSREVIAIARSRHPQG